MERKAERETLIRCALGRIFAMAARPSRPGDGEECTRLMYLVKNAMKPSKFPGDYREDEGDLV